MKLTADSLQDLSAGAVFLATGGGGDPYVAYLATKKVLEEHGAVELISVDELDDQACIVAIGGVGAPTVSLELLPSIDDAAIVLAEFERHINRRVDAVVSFEVGGGNSMIPIMAAASRGIPLVNGDGMGRALPEAQMMTFPIAGVSPTPAVGLDYAGNLVTFATDSTKTYERHVRNLAQAMGGMITTAEHPMTGRQLKASVVRDTISFAMEIGRILREYRGNAQRIFTPLSAAFGRSIYGELCHIYTGKVIDHSSAIIGGYDVGKTVIETFDGGEPPLSIDIRNEFLMARVGDRVVASVPDLITLLDYETSTPINAERLRYGQRVTVFGVGCPACYRTSKVLDIVGPECFGFDCRYVPLENLKQYHQPLHHAHR